MLPLALYIGFLLIGSLWIFCDAETYYIFDVFGRNFHYVWYQSGLRWRYSIQYGWRLLVLICLISANAFFSYWCYATNPFMLNGPVALFLSGAMLLSALMLVPWMYFAQRLRVNRFIRYTASQLDEFVQSQLVRPEWQQNLKQAEYAVERGWTAWHPKDDYWKSSNYWNGIVPVLYVEGDANSAVFVVDFNVFLGWKTPYMCDQVGESLPFQGPNESSFRVQSVRRLNRPHEWFVIGVEVESEQLDQMVARIQEIADLPPTAAGRNG